MDHPRQSCLAICVQEAAAGMELQTHRTIFGDVACKNRGNLALVAVAAVTAAGNHGCPIRITQYRDDG